MSVPDAISQYETSARRLSSLLTHNFKRYVSSSVIRNHGGNLIDISVPVSTLVEAMTCSQDIVSKVFWACAYRVQITNPSMALEPAIQLLQRTALQLR
jgi:hypothetical protein